MEDEKFKRFLGVVKVPELDCSDASEDLDCEVDETTKASSTRAKTLLREIGIDKDIQWCVEGIKGSRTKFEIDVYKTKLDALMKVIMIHKAAADTANKNSALASADGTAFDEVKVTLNRE